MLHFCTLVLPFLASLASAVPVVPERRTCTVAAGGSNATDDAPAIRQAFADCGSGGMVRFMNTTYYINSPMNIAGLKNCNIDLKGTLTWSTDIHYWLNHSMPVGYQNQSTAFILGGDNVHIDGHGYGTFDGNGDVWYAANLGSNYPGRPHAITFNGLTNSVVKGLIFFRSQMWSTSLIHCSHVTLKNIYVNNLDHNGNPQINTDGSDTIYSDHITYTKWTVINGDDAISPKANSTNILVTDCDFYRSTGFAIGSIGQYKGAFEIIENVTVHNVRFYSTVHTIYFKTWTGDQAGYPPNGGGGGLGYASNLTFTSITTSDVSSAVVSISQCTTFSGATNINCTNSAFQIRDVTFNGLRGTVLGRTQPIASLQCSALAPCTDITFKKVELAVGGDGVPLTSYLCGNVGVKHGWNCTGQVCVGPSGNGGC